ncbi:MAG: Mur ligase family protein [Oscillospiraceae bacterium]|jgi:UDP-N-acetylmuramyl tripeptide synthase|nr:Mur ligase family protein [Oscillospiraceae bacterium]
MSLRQIAAIAACKLTKTALRLLRRGGTTLPGRVALKICPDILQRVSRGVRSVVITGTNGKTTTARIVGEMCTQAGQSFISNRSGANLITGITTLFIDNCTLTGRARLSFAVVEADEAASREVCRFIQPEAILLTNLFRDQLDRYGEVTHTRSSVLTAIKNAPNAKVCLNADDSLSVSISCEVSNEILFYGVDVPIYKGEIDEVSDAPFCIRCKHAYEYDYRTYGHLGGFRCPECGYRRPEPQISVTEILELGEASSTVKAQLFGEEDEYIINLPGGYNIYNAVGALSLGEAAGFPREAAKCAVAGFDCGFGRMERFELGKTTARMLLVKNPAGCNQALNYLSGLTDETLFVCCLNDNFADGTDISWIWDANFELLARQIDLLPAVFVAGERRADMALRLKYAGLPTEKLQIFDDYDALIDAMAQQDKPVVIMPTYTAMMDLREKMSARFGGGAFWE